MERTGRDKEHVIRLHHAIFGVDRASLDDGEDIPLHALAADVRSVCRAAGHFVDLVDEDNPILLRAAQGLVGHGIHVDELAFFLGHQHAARIADLHAAHLRLFGQHVAHHRADVHARAVDLHILGRVLHLDLNFIILQLAAHELSAQLLAAPGNALALVFRQFRRAGLVAQQHVDGVDGLAVRMQDDVHNPVLGQHGCAGLDLLAGLFLADAHAGLHQIADDALHIPPDVAHLGKLGGLHLDKGSVHQARKPARDFGLAHARGADHQDILGDNLIADLLRQLRAAVAVAQRHGHGALGVVLADDIAVELAHDLLGRQLHIRVTSSMSDMQGIASIASRKSPAGKKEACRPQASSTIT